jgi:transcriptional regulator of met regulon
LRFDQLIEDNFKIPDILTDENFQPVSFRDFMTSNLVSLAGQIKKLEEKCTSEYLVQDLFHDFVKQSVPRTDKLYEEIERLNGETLKSELGI